LIYLNKLLPTLILLSGLLSCGGQTDGHGGSAGSSSGGSDNSGSSADITCIGWFTGATTTTAPATNTNFNQATAYSLQWTASDADATCFTHSTVTNNHKVTIATDGDYLVSINVPVVGAVSNGSIITDVRKNGTAMSVGRCASVYIANANGHAESSNNCTFFLSGLVAGDEIDVTVKLGGGVGTITVLDEATMFMEYVGSSRKIFYATATQTTNSTNLNDTTDYAISWTHSVQDTGFSHTNGSGDITLSTAGTYVVHITIPLTTADTGVGVEGMIKLDGTIVTSGQFRQGYLVTKTESSISWSGIVVSTSSNQVLSLYTGDSATPGTITVSAGYEASIFIEKLSSDTGVLFVDGNSLVSGASLNSNAASSHKWTNSTIADATYYTHSTATNPQSITVEQAGDYLLMLNSSNFCSPITSRTNFRIRVAVNGTNVSGAIASSHYCGGSVGNNLASGALTFLLEGLSASDVITVTAQREANTGTVTNNGTLLVLIKK